MAFLVLKNQHLLYSEKFSNNERDRARAFEMALDENTLRGKHLAAFVRKGGDETLPDPGHCYYQEFLREHPEWREATTIFSTSNGPFRNLEPFIRFQQYESMVSFIISASNMILYYMRMTTGTTKEATIHQYSLNVGRFMLNHLTNEHIFEMVFKAEGGYPVCILEDLLQFCQQTRANQSKVGQFRIFSYWTPSLFVATVAAALHHTGPLLVDNF